MLSYGWSYDYYSEMDYADLAEMFGETAKEIESDFSAWYDKHRINLKRIMSICL